MSNRYTIEAKDLMRLTGKSERQCRRIISTVKKEKGIPAASDMPLHTLCEALGWKEEKVRGLLA